MPTLPTELIGNILEHVNGSYPSLKPPVDLYRCALVCRTWHMIAQPLIFAEFHVDLEDKRINAVQENPHLRQHVRQVWVSWYEEPMIKGTLDSLPNLRKVYFLRDLSYYILDQMNPSDSERFLRNLTSLGLSCVIEFPIQHFYQCTSLRYLKINRATFNFEYTPPSNDSPRPQLHSFHIAGYTGQLLQWILHPQSAFDLTVLNSFRVVDRSDQVEPYESAREVIKLCASTLQELHLDPPTMYGIADLELTFETFPYPSTLFNLRVISITIIQEYYDYTNFIPWLSNIFSLFPTGNHLEEIRIPCVFVDLPSDDEDLSLQDHMIEYKWEHLDSALTVPLLESLKRVVIGIHEPDNRDRVEELEFLLRKLLPGLDKRGILEFLNVTSYKDLVRFSGDSWEVDS